MDFRAAFIAALATWLGCFTPAFAETDTNNGVEAPSNNNGVKKTDEVRQKYIEKLEARIRSLEKQNERLQRLEKKIDTLSAKLALRDGRSNWREPSVSGRGDSASMNQPAPISLAPSTNSQTTPPNVQTATGEKSNAGTQPNSTAPATPAALADQEDADALRDLAVIRDQAVTTKQGGIEVIGNLRYVRESTPLQFSRAFVATGAVYYGILPDLQFSGTVPYYWSYRSTAITPTSFFDTNISSVGDISAQLTGTLYRETLNLPGIYGYGAITAPTGPNPYWIPPGQTPPAEPINPLFFTQSSGHWNGTAGFTAAKALEPIILFGGVNYTHYLARDFAGSIIQPGDRYTYNMGFGLAVSERTMLGTLVQGVYQHDLVMNGIPRVGATNAEAVLLTLSLSQRIAMGFYFEPAVTIGMTADAPAAQIIVQMRKNFDPVF